MKKIVHLTLLMLSVIFISACEGVDLGKLSDEDLSRLSEKAIVCKEPYMRFGTSCCLDQNNNNVCDKDERGQETKIEKEENKTPIVKEEPIARETPKVESETKKEDDTIICKDPYMRFGNSCCLDQNHNNICDADEKVQEKPKEVIQVIPTPKPTQTTCHTKEPQFNVEKTGISKNVDNTWIEVTCKITNLESEKVTYTYTIKSFVGAGHIVAQVGPESVTLGPNQQYSIVKGLTGGGAPGSATNIACDVKAQPIEVCTPQEQKVDGSCTLQAGIECLDFSVNKRGIFLAIRNQLGFDIGVAGVKVGDCEYFDYFTMTPGLSFSFSIPCGITGSIYEAPIEIVYLDRNTAVSYTITGKLKAKIE